MLLVHTNGFVKHLCVNYWLCFYQYAVLKDNLAKCSHTETYLLIAPYHKTAFSFCSKGIICHCAIRILDLNLNFFVFWTVKRFGYYQIFLYLHRQDFISVPYAVQEDLVLDIVCKLSIHLGFDWFLSHTAAQVIVSQPLNSGCVRVLVSIVSLIQVPHNSLWAFWPTSTLLNWAFQLRHRSDHAIGLHHLRGGNQ